MLVLESRDAAGDAEGFRSAGIGEFEPFFFERQARRPDGSEVRVAFSLAFAENEAAPECGFFVCQQHDNVASGLSAVFLVTQEPAAQADFLSAFSGAESFATPEGGLRLPLPRGRLEVLAHTAAGNVLDGESRRQQAHFAGFAATVPDFEPLRQRLSERGIAHRQQGARFIVPGSAAFGCAIIFERG